MVFAPFWSQTPTDFADFGLESCTVFEETTRVYERIYRFQLQMKKKEREICEVENSPRIPRSTPRVGNLGKANKKIASIEKALQRVTITDKIRATYDLNEPRVLNKYLFRRIMPWALFMVNVYVKFIS